MSRMIDADALIAEIKSSSAYNDYEWSMYADGFIEDIESAPTAVVNCIDCRLCSERGGHANCNGYLICTLLNRVVDEDTYCAWGERK